MQPEKVAGEVAGVERCAPAGEQEAVEEGLVVRGREVALAVVFVALLVVGATAYGYNRGYSDGLEDALTPLKVPGIEIEIPVERGVKGAMEV